jgi:predicted PurR-regulated permease PerM
MIETLYKAVAVAVELSSEVSEAVSVEGSSEAVAVTNGAKPTIEWIQRAWDWLNQPLPIVGISIIAVLIFAWRVFVTTSYGKKAIKKLTAISEETRTSAKEALEQAKEEKEALQKELEEMRGELEQAREVLTAVCEQSRNAKTKALADTLKGGEQDGQEGTNGNANEE